MKINLFLPKIYKKDIFGINYNQLKKDGIKCLLFDLDNTISPAKETIFCDKTKELFDNLKKDFNVIIVSNNVSKRVKLFADFYGVKYEYLSLKPLSFKYRKVMRHNKYNNTEIAVIGDQIVTDIFGGNKMKLKTILVDPISDIDQKGTYFNRKIEKKIFNRFNKLNLFEKGKYYE